MQYEYSEQLGLGAAAYNSRVLLWLNERTLLVLTQAQARYWGSHIAALAECAERGESDVLPEWVHLVLDDPNSKLVAPPDLE